jgi:hypothetical protein
MTRSPQRRSRTRLSYRATHPALFDISGEGDNVFAQPGGGDVGTTIIAEVYAGHWLAARSVGGAIDGGRVTGGEGAARRCWGDSKRSTLAQTEDPLAETAVSSREGLGIQGVIPDKELRPMALQESLGFPT